MCDLAEYEEGKYECEENNSRPFLSIRLQQEKTFLQFALRSHQTLADTYQHSLISLAKSELRVCLALLPL